MQIEEMTLKECYQALAHYNFGRLGCARNNQPYIVPIFFAFHGGSLYGSNVYCFSRMGQKIDWMRGNPLVCLEIDDVKSQWDWMSVVVLGRFEELTDTAEHEVARRHAYELLSKRRVWWEPASLNVRQTEQHYGVNPIYYRISIDQLTGRRGLPASQKPSAPPAEGWLSAILRSVRD
jgi:nitroimidazol reductase NimA-like FMN-containing flavoprotein (pyridoxamine 5'-phosphate oxidase superfamily)